MACRVDVFVWRLDPSAPPADADLAILSDDERARLKRFVFDKDKARYLQSHAQLRRLLGARVGIDPPTLDFLINEYDKPRLRQNAAPHFNLSHSNNLAALAICDRFELGVDIEHIRTIQEDIAGRFFSPSECAALNAVDLAERDAAFFRCWTRKEAFVKARGEGLTLSLQAFDVTLDDPPMINRIEGDDPSRWRLWSFIPAEGYQGAIALAAGDEDISFNVVTSG